MVCGLVLMNDFNLIAMLGPWEIIGILAIALLLFGSKKLPELARGLGTGLREFKKATSDVSNDLQRAIEEDPKSPGRPAPPTPRTYPEPPKAKPTGDESRES
jgi:sec-independent protein translocase protein TatA